MRPCRYGDFVVIAMLIQRLRKMTKATLILWVVTTFIGISITKTVHTGPLLIAIYDAISWPIVWYVFNPSALTLLVALVLQLAYCLIWVAFWRWLLEME